MSTLDLSSFRALTFDCYGTLIDWEAGILSVLRPWARRTGIAADDAALLTAFSEEEPHCQAETPAAPYPDILHRVHERLATRFNAPLEATDAMLLGESIGAWLPFPDTVAALQALKRRYRLVIVSNVDRASFAKTNARLGVAFDAIVTAQDAGSYKPAPEHFVQALSILSAWSIAREQVLHVAQSLFHDHVPAKALGLRTVWITRVNDSRGAATRPPELPVAPDLAVPTLGDLARLAEAACA